MNPKEMLTVSGSGQESTCRASNRSAHDLLSGPERYLTTRWLDDREYRNKGVEDLLQHSSQLKEQDTLSPGVSGIIPDFGSS